ncbi:MAG: hypothetical protein M0R02_03370 [Bacteroidales bacterium]|nr:hypothetical protein [Bacteroidales bacterium]NLK80906.1 hypothetical protein [Bacteroidales bacterium]HPY81815.1 hypothetical protein [Bacteroidales bacterium]
MKAKLFPFICTILLSIGAVAQEEEQVVSNSNKQIGVSITTTLNNPTKLSPFSYFGIGGYYTIIDNLAFEGIAGMGSWGYYGTLSLQYFIPEQENLFIKGTCMRSGGGKEKNLSTMGYSKYADTQINLFPIINANFTVGRVVDIYKSLSFSAEIGYAYRFGNIEDKYRILESNIVFDEDSKNIVSKMAPGGFIFSLGLTYNL